MAALAFALLVYSSSSLSIQNQELINDNISLKLLTLEQKSLLNESKSTLNEAKSTLTEANFYIYKANELIDRQQGVIKELQKRLESFWDGKSIALSQ
jgi:predicted alpha/beta superfamily hydrolase